MDNPTPERSTFAYPASFVVRTESDDLGLSQALLSDYNQRMYLGSFGYIQGMRAWNEDVCNAVEYDILEADAVLQGFPVPRIE